MGEVSDITGEKSSTLLEVRQYFYDANPTFIEFSSRLRANSQLPSSSRGGFLRLNLLRRTELEARHFAGLIAWQPSLVPPVVEAYMPWAAAMTRQHVYRPLMRSGIEFDQTVPGWHGRPSVVLV